MGPPAMEPNDLLGMSLDQLSTRGTRPYKSGSGGSGGGGGGAWFADRHGGGARGRDGGGGGGGMRSEVARPQSGVAGAGGTFRSAMASARAPQQYPSSQSSGSGPIRRAGVARAARESAAPYQQRPARNAESVFDRLGEREGWALLVALH